MIYFVYGSLLSGEYNHHVLGDSKKLYDGYITGFSMYSLGSFPTIIENDEDGIIYGEIYEVNDHIIEQKLDFLEGYTGNKLDNFYDKKLVQVTPIDNNITQCQFAFVYYFNSTESYNLSNLNKIKNGNWKLRNKR